MNNSAQHRINFLINYSISKSLSDNRNINEQRYIPGVTPNPKDFTPLPEKKDPNQYPNYCRYPEKAILPGKNEVGVSGLEGIPEGYCCYPIPMPKSKNGGLSYIFLPQDAKINFWTEVEYNHLFEKTLKLPKDEKIKYFNYYNKIFPYGSVFSFEISDLTYVSWMEHERDSKFGVFNWFFSDNDRKMPYPKIKWTDPRNNWDKIVDDYGTASQWVAAAAFFIAGFFTEGSTWLVLAEMFTEGTFGIITAQRDLEKGENLSAAFDLIFGLTPFLKVNKFFSGIDSTTARSLVRSMKKAGLSKESTPKQIVEWYMSLGEKEQKLWSKMVKAGDEFSEEKIKNVLKEGMEEFRKHIKENPQILRKVNWYQKVGIKELTVNGFLQVFDILFETFFGKKLNEEEKKKLTTIYNNSSQVSSELANELKINLLANADKAKSTVNSETSKKYVKDLTYTAAKRSLEWINTQNKKMIQDGGGQWTENPNDNIKPLKNVSIDDSKVKELEQNGYKKESLMTKEDWENANTPIEINGTIYWKVKK